jgi:hypothetical protein
MVDGTYGRMVGHGVGAVGMFIPALHPRHRVVGVAIVDEDDGEIAVIE